MVSDPILSNVLQEFRRHQRLAEEALAQVDDEAFFQRPAAQVNPLALIVKHVAGNLRSRWTDFLTSDGEKSDRNRDGEFRLDEGDTRERLMAAWRESWGVLFSALENLSDADLGRSVTIRGEPHTVPQAVLRSLTHTVYHIGQILYVVRMLRPESTWLTIAPGQSGNRSGPYLGNRDPK